MEDESWSFGVSTSSSSKFNYSDTNQSRYDYFVDYEDIEGDDDIEADYPCPFCSEDFDIVGLCCHIEEEHSDESKKGVCPMCGTNVGADLVEHIALQHENVYKSGNKNRHNDVVDQLLTSFICSYTTPAEAESEPSSSPADALVKEEITDDEMLERSMKNCSISDEKQEEQAQRCKFVQSLLFSAFLDDGL